MFPLFRARKPEGGPRRRAMALLAAATAAFAATLVACGGGTSQLEPFVPERLFAFGDEASALTTGAPTGRNYGINGINNNNTPDDATDDFFDCRVQPNWVQSLAAFYGFVFAECSRDGVAETKARNRAAPGARVAEVALQVDAQVAAGGFRDKDLATLMVGVNDVVELYRQYDGSNEEALVAEARERGNRAGQVVNRLITLGAKVVVSNIPDLGFTPFAKAENAAHPEAPRTPILSRLSAAFNERLGVTILLDGRFVALVQTDQRMLAITRAPVNFGIANAVDAACATPPPSCTNQTLVTDANSATYLWAGDVLLSSRGQSEVAQLAITRATRNPF